MVFRILKEFDWKQASFSVLAGAAIGDIFLEFRSTTRSLRKFRELVCKARNRCELCRGF